MCVQKFMFVVSSRIRVLRSWSVCRLFIFDSLTALSGFHTSNEQLEGGDCVNSKTAGEGASLGCAEIINNIHFEENVTRKDAAIEMYDLLRLTQMDRRKRAHTDVD